jgi:hypothetical protein
MDLILTNDILSEVEEYFAILSNPRVSASERK